VAILYYISYTVFYAPYNALGYEMTDDYDERTSLMAYKWSIGTIVGLLILPRLLPMCYNIDPQNAAIGARVLGPVVGLLILLFAMAPGFIIRERIIHQEKMPFMNALSFTLRNKPFLILCGIIVLCLTGILAMLQLRQFLNMAYIFQMNEQISAGMNMWFDYVYGITSVVCMFAASSLASRFDKKKVLVVGLLLIVVGMASSWFYITPKHPYLQLLLALLTAPGMSCVWVLTNSCIADVCDYDELQTGLRREGFYGAVYAFFMKLGSALGLGLGGLILYLVGFDKELTAQSAETIIRFRWIFAIVPAAFFVAAVVLALKYPITKQKLLEVQRQLALRKNQQV
jgi:GPH family glycoside/pentoside/hexuronide:cation symporter